MCKMEKARFSLLLLEPGEIYFEDFSAYLLTENTTEDIFESGRQHGRLKMCSKSLVFDPHDCNQPILKIPLKDCCKIQHGERPWNNLEDNIIEVECTSYAEMLQGNVIAPYTFKHEKTKFLFLLNYAKVDDCMPQILQLHRASTLLPPEQNSMIAAIVFSRQSRLSFDTKWLEDLYENVILETQANKISPLVVNPGRVLLSSSRIYFQPYNNVEPYPVLKINLKDITRIICRRFLLKQVGIEIYSDCNNSGSGVEHLYLVMKSKKDRDNFYQSILEQPNLNLKISEQEIMTLKWQNCALSTYDYLLYLNSLADRSFNDLTQYPVFPWVLSDYTSQVLDLDDPNTYRDLSKPIGAINGERLERLKERCQEMSEPKFLYGSHYSAPGFILFYLIRKFPHYMLCLQNGRFDHPDRMFNSIADVWRNVTVNMSDFKELIPEFYDVSQSGDFLLNKYGINFGYRFNGSKIHDVQLPPWAENASDFVSKLREALESDYVSENLHHWIDLIFGYKQRGIEAQKADNLYYYLCYEGAVDVDSIQDINERHALEVQIMEFGQIPKQIFKIPHPQRLPPSSGVRCRSGSGDSVKRSHSSGPSWKDIWYRNNSTVLYQHRDVVTCLAISSNNEYVLSGGKDSVLKMYSTQNRKQIRSISLSTVGIASCVFLPDNNLIILGTYDDQILVYDIAFGKIIDSIRAHEDAVTSVCWGEESRCLVTASWDCSIKVWKGMFQGEKWNRLKQNFWLRYERDSRVSCIAINRDNNLLACGTDDGEVTVWNIVQNTVSLDRSTHDNKVSAVSFSPDGVKLISCGFDGYFKVHDLLTGMEVYCRNFEARLTCLAWDGFSLVLGSNSGALFFWDLIEVKLVKEVECLGKHVSCIAVSNDGALFVTAEDKLVVLRA